MTTVTDFEIRKASPRLGAEIAWVDLTAGVDDATAEALREAFWARKVLVFRGQHLSPTQHVEAVRIFDEPFYHPTAVHRHPDSELVSRTRRHGGAAAGARRVPYQVRGQHTA
jgi:alpha-ketoglutarate-dependent taurine dioxygenase